MFVITKTLGVKAKSKVNAYNLELQPCTILSLVCCIFSENYFNQAALFPPESIFEKKETEILSSWCWGRRREPRSVCPSIYLFVCLLAGRPVGLSVCLSVCISVCLAFYLEQKVIEEACAFFNLLFVCSFFFFLQIGANLLTVCSTCLVFSLEF